MIKERFKIVERGCAYSLDDQVRVVYSICLLYNAVRVFERGEFSIGPVVPARGDLAAGRIFEQEDLSVLDPDTGRGDEDDGSPEPEQPRARSFRSTRNRERRELEDSVLRRAGAMWDAYQEQALQRAA